MGSPQTLSLIRKTLLIAYCCIPTLMITTGVAEEAIEGTIIADEADAAPAYNSDNSQYSRERINDTTINIGRQGPQGRFHQAMVMPFQLPDLGEVENPFQSASFTFYFSSTVNDVSNFNLDLYGLAVRDNAAVLPASPSTTDPGDFFMGGFDGWPTVDETEGVVKLQDNILTSAIDEGSYVTTSTAGSEELLDYLNVAYDGGEGIGEWAFLRLSTDATPGGVVYYTIASANNSNTNHHPRIVYTADPPPPSYGTLLSIK